MKISTYILMLFTLSAFAANSILCRLALSSDSIGAIEFTIIRLMSGIFILLPIILFRNNFFSKAMKTNNRIINIKLHNFWQSLTLFGYAIFFSLAYVQLDTGIGALILFPTVQISMMGISIFQGNKISRNELIGFSISFVGMVYLLLPGYSAPPLVGALLMICSGVSWAVYSLLGKKETQPILVTARNFLFCIPGIILLVLFLLLNSQSQSIHITSDGFILAIFSGAIASGIGYVLWYLSLVRISTTLASVSQLIVPIFAALGGFFFLDEALSFRLLIASVLILGGIVITILNKSKT